MIISASLNVRYTYFLILVVIFFVPYQAHAQVHFVDCSSSTGNEATLIIPVETEPTLDTQPLAVGDEIAVYTPRGTCAGAAVWEDSSVALTVWGDDNVTENVTEGFEPGEAFSFRIWDASTSIEYRGEDLNLDITYTAAPPYNGTGEYEQNSLYLLTSFAAGTGSSTDAPSPREHPLEYILAPNYPNPFNHSTTISYELAKAGDTRLSVYDMLGRRVRVLLDKHQEAGSYEVRFDARMLPGGSYVYRLESDAFAAGGIMVLAK